MTLAGFRRSPILRALHRIAMARIWPEHSSQEFHNCVASRCRCTSFSCWGEGMRATRREFVHFGTAVIALGANAWPVRAEEYPNHPVRIISGFPPGGINDTYARLIAQWLSEHLGQQFFVENRSGAGGTLAAEAVARVTRQASMSELPLRTAPRHKSSNSSIRRSTSLSRTRR